MLEGGGQRRGWNDQRGSQRAVPTLGHGSYQQQHISPNDRIKIDESTSQLQFKQSKEFKLEADQQPLSDSLDPLPQNQRVSKIACDDDYQKFQGSVVNVGGQLQQNNRFVEEEFVEFNDDYNDQRLREKEQINQIVDSSLQE